MSTNLLSRLFAPAVSAERAADATPCDYACPACGAQGELSVLFCVKARLTRVDGQDRPETPDMSRWCDGNGMSCGDCGWTGAASSARVDRLA